MHSSVFVINGCGKGQLAAVKRTMPPVALRRILNTYKTLLTLGQKGCYVYCEDKALREYFLSSLRT